MTADELSAVNYDEVAVQETYKSWLRCFLNARNGVWKKGQGSFERNGAFTDFGYCQNTTIRESGTSPFIANSPETYDSVLRQKKRCASVAFKGATRCRPPALSPQPHTTCGILRGTTVSRPPDCISPATYDLWNSQRGDWVSTPRLHLPCHIRRLLAFLEGRRISIPRRVQPNYDINKPLNLNKLSIVGQFG